MPRGAHRSDAKVRISEGRPPERTLNDGATFPRQLTFTTRTLRSRFRELTTTNPRATVSSLSWICNGRPADGRRQLRLLRLRLLRLRLRTVGRTAATAAAAVTAAAAPAAVGRTAEPNEICTEENWRWRANHRSKPRRKRAKFAPKKTGGGDRITESFQGAQFDAVQHEPPKRQLIPP